MKLPVYSIEGKQVGERELSDAVFGVVVQPTLVHQVVVSEQANARQVLAHTLTRSEVRGGGKKPWKQKGTGRARHGSIRSPLWRGGGITFGPRSDRNFAQVIPQKMKRKAVLMGLSDKVQDQKLVIVDELSFTGKAKDYSTIAAKLFGQIFSAKKSPSVLLVLPTLNDEVKRATSNLDDVEAIRTDSLYLRAILQNDVILTTNAGIDALEQWFTSRKDV